MATTSPDTLQRQDFGPVEIREAELDGYTVSFLHVKQPVDMGQMLRGLPDDRCHCAHWGIVTDGGMTVHFADHDETLTTGDVFYLAELFGCTSLAGVRFAPPKQFAAEPIRRS